MASVFTPSVKRKIWQEAHGPRLWRWRFALLLLAGAAASLSLLLLFGWLVYAPALLGGVLLTTALVPWSDNKLVFLLSVPLCTAVAAVFHAARSGFVDMVVLGMLLLGIFSCMRKTTQSPPDVTDPKK